MPKYIVYDDACHLKQFCQSRLHTSQRARIFENKIFVVDKLHIQGHKDPYCLANCHPKLFEDVNEVNTVVCEQINYWIGQYKYIMKHMSYYRYNFFLFLLLSEYNLIKLDGRFSLINNIIVNKDDMSKLHVDVEVEDEY